MVEENTSSTKPTTRPGRRLWTIEIVDTGETIIGSNEKHDLIRRHYNPERGQTEYPERAEAIGEVFAWLADHFDKGFK